MDRLSILFLVLLTIPLMSVSQNLDGFEEMLEQTVSGSVPYISHDHLADLLDQEIFIIDTREREEFDISHIPGSRYVGYSDIDDELLSSIPHGSTIITYCSIGYRSEKIGERLISLGHEKVYNLRGGIFSWANCGGKLEGDDPKAVHGYNEEWSKWLNSERVKVITGM